ncbi:MAG: 50S ribosomal protein L9 [candidate division Zixibacteria bacterium]|nr:50S ribosomal protein L9 [candidate division Zixibacteria bacterium]MCI0595897.1 50S ribosomal protein L9 [candidate division Zixibacteria bacterium]
MKVILKEDVEKLGKVGEVVRVADGYARNFLIPRELATVATKGTLRAVEHITREKALRDQKKRRELERLKATMEKLSLMTEKETGEEDRLFGSVTSSEIALLLAQQGVTVDRRKIELAEPIKTLGIYEVPVRLGLDITATVKLWVVRKKEEISG